MRPKISSALLVLLALLTLGGALAWLARGPSQREPAVAAAPAGHHGPVAAVASKPRPDLPGPAVELVGQGRALCDSLRLGLAAADAARRLEEMAFRLRAAPRDVAVAVLLTLLDQGIDGPTGLAFQVGAGGHLASASTFRVWLLDLLGQLDPAEGARYARRIYERHDSADEWAIALRNDWRVAAPAGQIAAVRQRALELVEEVRWAQAPSRGFLEAFDLTVATMAWEAVPRLEELLAPSQSESVRRASWVAIDRLALETPADFLPLLAQRPEWLNSQPLIRAGLFARADLAADRERRAVESYLRRPDLSPEEGARFFELAPNVNATISHNLATTIRVPTLHDAARLDRAALEAVQSWQSRPEFQRWNPVMAQAEARLRASIASAIRGGFSKP